jgi:hypothetical protein
MQQEATNSPVLSYAKAPPNRRWRVIALLLGGGFAWFVLWLALSFNREVRWVNRTAWVLEFPLIRLAWALGLPLPTVAILALGFLNGLCWSVLVFLCVRFLRRPRPRAA